MHSHSLMHVENRNGEAGKKKKKLKKKEEAETF